ncbi:hypothetical protein GCM10022243_61920 [Saccharothrix violaceirubra]|uniref:8-oxo-dGTP diphosphatase n=1 Tax=Saccharothrix violaceirubra TaxID=413306 RepID=A0A7W7T7U1_9PSEU|nr:NUDIX hydrolase [Saccharothrix violaceirubra]MBB4968168.1 8-oxo-dGTP diphosphatase [Saccharothrix violaceirubra]
MTALTADVVLFTRRRGVLSVLTITRGKPPYEGALALPGGFVEQDERPLEAAVRELAEETGLHLPKSRLRRVGSYDTPGRDPRGAVASTAFHAYVIGAPDVRGGSDAATATWTPLATLLSPTTPTAFDHRRIVRDAVHRRFGRAKALPCRAIRGHRPAQGGLRPR